MQGIELRGANGNPYICNGKGTSLYYGYVDITLDWSGSGYNSSRAAYGAKIEALKLPALKDHPNMNVVMFTRALNGKKYDGKSDASNGYFVSLMHRNKAYTDGWGHVHPEGWILYMDGYSWFGTVRCYFFIDSWCFSTPDYGVAVYDDNKRAIFHTARPALTYKEIMRTGQKFTNNKLTTPYVPAVPVWRIQQKFFGSIGWGGRPSLGSYYLIKTPNAIGTSVFEATIHDQLTYNASTEQHFAPVQYFPVIDGGFYERFSNMLKR